jgi:hypothetical protein
MKKAISYALFGYNKERQQNCFDFASYLRGLLMSIRMNRLVFPGWENVVQTDQSTYNAYKELFDSLPIVVNVNDDAPLTKAMLWRMKPVFEYNNYSHVICRDLDSPPTYREAQCVQEWVNSNLAAHAITDSISHGVPLLGGMIGFVTGYWPMRTKLQHWGDMFKDCNIDFSRKGADQDYLNSKIYPCFADPNAPAIMQHYILGMPNTFLPGYRNSTPLIPVESVPEEMNESNECCSHMGQAGWLLPQTFRLFRKYHDRFTDLLEIEKKWPDIAYWVKDGTFN